MGLIYFAAPRLTIWLGPAYSNSDIALTTLRHLASGHPFEKTAPMEPKVLNAVEKLLTRSWWRRVWIFQELRFGAIVMKLLSAQVMCGKEQIRWTSVVLACARMKVSKGIWRRSSPTVDNVLRLDLLAQRIPKWQDRPTTKPINRGLARNFKDVVEFRDFEATDPKDKISALSGMQLVISCQRSAMPVAYEYTKEQLYTVFAAIVLEETKRLEVLRYCQSSRTTGRQPTQCPLGFRTGPLLYERNLFPLDGTMRS
jgi:hypothetical protein